MGDGDGEVGREGGEGHEPDILEDQRALPRRPHVLVDCRRVVLQPVLVVARVDQREREPALCPLNQVHEQLPHERACTAIAAVLG